MLIAQIQLRFSSIFFLLNIISWTWLLGSGLKLILQWKAQLTVFCKASFSSLTEVLISWTTENRNVPSANSLHSILRPSDKSLIYIKNNKSPNIDPWGTSAWTSAQDEHWPFKTTLCFLWRRKSRKILMLSPFLPFWRNLKIRPICHTLPEAFETSRSIPRTSSPLSNKF